MTYKNIKKIIRSIIDPYGKISFYVKTKKNSSMLDVGCGNNQVALIKSINHTINYSGIDIGDYNLSNSSKNAMDNYILCDPEEFSIEIKNHGKYDYVVSSHNLEHCNDWRETAKSMCDATLKNGLLFISTPSKKTIKFPNREGTLNFYDDSTHNEPVNFFELKKILTYNNIEIVYCKDGHNSFFTYIIGFFQEFKSKRVNRVL